MKISGIAVVLLLLLPIPSAYAKSVPTSFPGGWSGQIFFDNTTGEFTHCVASDEYNNGTTLIISINRYYYWTLGFLNDAWRLVPNTKPTVFFRVDSSLWRSFSARAYSSDAMYVDMPANDQEMINLFRFGRIMQIRFDAWDYSFELSGTSRLLAGLAECVTNQLSPPGVAKAPQEKQEPRKEAEPKNTISKEAEKQRPDGEGPSTGTGIVVNRSGLILTNNHVVENCQTINFSKEGELTQSASLLRVDKSNDLALLKPTTPFTSSNPATFRLSPSVKAGEQVAVYGFPLTGMLSVSGNVVSGNVSSLAGLGDDVRFFQLSAPVQPGNSGGPLLDYSGNVIGIVTARISDFAVVGVTGSLPQNVNFAIKASIVTSFMDTHGTEYNTTSAGQEGNLSTVAEAAKKFTVMIECKP